MNSSVQQLIVIVLALTFANSLLAIHPIQQDSLREVLIEQGTLVKLYLAQDIKSEQSSIQQEKTVLMEVAEDVIVNGKYKVIRTGGNAIGTISKTRKRRILGRDAYLEVTAFSVICADGRSVYLQGKPEGSGDKRHKRGLAITLLVIGILSLVGGIACLALAKYIGGALLLSIGLVFSIGALTTKGSTANMLSKEQIFQAYTTEDIWVTVDIY